MLSVDDLVDIEKKIYIIKDNLNLPVKCLLDVAIFVRVIYYFSKFKNIF